jgi:hypothetical protein
MSVTVKIRETNEIKSLGIVSENGVDWTADFIGNAGGFTDDPEGFERTDDGEDYYGIATQAWFDWWKKHIANYEKMETEIEDFKEELNDVDDADCDRAEEIIRDCQYVYSLVDEEQGPGAVIEKINEYRDELGIKRD